MPRTILPFHLEMQLPLTALWKTMNGLIRIYWIWPNGAHRLYPITWGKAVFDKVGLAVDYTNENEQFYIWPNPSNDRVFVKHITKQKIKDVTILDIFGRELKTENFTKNGIDISNLPSGIYFFVINQQYYRIK
jgi:hypothetical protein